MKKTLTWEIGVDKIWIATGAGIYYTRQQYIKDAFDQYTHMKMIPNPYHEDQWLGPTAFTYIRKSLEHTRGWSYKDHMGRECQILK